ncbi:uncharacterized protein LOC113976177 isoform X1 [Neopelma chrysocephalum]|uniref:uncharacterized protein LOC113976177 isoform X1 n=1 Tax=Neopelma chrysocephalum TaxID=114329 RepID=UPI000FCD245F|nr:uncharacterized protein LOC113976177 isoform X1 [Neopelma chrysocephalum]
MQGRRAPSGRVLLVGLKALAAFAALAVLVALYARATSRGRVDKSGPLGAAPALFSLDHDGSGTFPHGAPEREGQTVPRSHSMSKQQSDPGNYQEIVQWSISVLIPNVSGGNGDEGSGSGSPGGHMDTSSLWELPAQSPTVSEASADVSGGNGDEGSGSGSPGGHMDMSSLWELPAQGPNVSEASPAGPKNGTEPGDIYWQLEETLTEVLGALKEMPDVVEFEPLDEQAPQEGHQEVPFPGEKPRAAQPTGGSGVEKRRLGRTKPKAVAGRAHRGAVDAEVTRKILLSNCLVAVAGVLTVLFLCLVVPAWAKDIQGHLATWRARFRPLGNREEVEI